MGTLVIAVTTKRSNPTGGVIQPIAKFTTANTPKNTGKINRESPSTIQHYFNSNNEGDTVGAVAMDEHGNLAAATSTGGHRHSFPGRIGDSPIIGAGTYANDFCAVSNTGRGENVLKVVAAKRVCDIVKEHGLNAMLAVDKMIKEF